MGRKKIQISQIMDQRNRQTLRRKGLDGQELDRDEALQATERYQHLSSSTGHPVARQRYYGPSLLPADAQYAVSMGCENALARSLSPKPGLLSHRPSLVKPPGPKSGSSASPAGPHGHPSLMPPHSGTSCCGGGVGWGGGLQGGSSSTPCGMWNVPMSSFSLSHCAAPATREDRKSPPPPEEYDIEGIGYSVFSHGNLSLACANRRMEAQSVSPDSRSNMSGTRALYHGIHPGNHMVAMGKAGLLGHAIGGYRHPAAGPAEYAHAGSSHSMSLQRGMAGPWRSSHDLEGETSLTCLGMPTGGCSFPQQVATVTPSPHLHPLGLSIKSERVSPEHGHSPTTPPPRHAGQHAEPYPAGEREDPRRGGATKASSEGGGGLPTGQPELTDGWQR
ncbi:hypothetical protein JZ751_013821 [Albula glossodonta]|uniref:Uncharacterized protein n=1 Tax=Albula glossodonta TaxID=121402 RepID=A0A8T2NX10_9TELE|nr:hypothetical protein JZ751_013821 [Albula glossodonta]